jgi:hypothetical protein
MNKQETLFKEGQGGSFMDAVYGAFIEGDKEKARHVLTAIQAFTHYPATKRDEVIQAFTVKGDMPELTTRLPYINIQTPNYDMNYELAFRMATLDVINGVSKLSWEIVTGTDTIVFDEMAEGQSPIISSAAGTLQRVTCTRKSGALGWTEELIRDRAINTLVQRAELFRAKFYQDKANRHYSVLNTAGTAGGSISWQTTTETVGVTLDRDRKSINEAAYQIANAVKDKGYGDSANAQFILYVNPIMRSRMTNAFSQQSVVNANRIEWNVTPVYTFNSEMPTNSAYGIMVLPGNKIQRADAMAPTTFLKADVASMTYVEYVHAFYGAVAADTDQARIVQFA